MYINYKKQSSFLSYCEDKALWQKQIHRERVHSAHNSGLQSITAQKFEWQDREATGHITSAVGGKRRAMDSCNCSVSILPAPEVQNHLPREWFHPTIKVCLPTAISITEILLHGHTQRPRDSEFLQGCQLALSITPTTNLEPPRLLSTSY